MVWFVSLIKEIVKSPVGFFFLCLKIEKQVGIQMLDFIFKTARFYNKCVEMVVVWGLVIR